MCLQLRVSGITCVWACDAHTYICVLAWHVHTHAHIVHRRSHTTDNGTQVFEGERYLTRENQLLGRFLLAGIGPSMPGDNNIRVSFTIDLHNDLNVTATDLFSGVSKVLASSISPQPHLRSLSSPICIGIVRKKQQM